MRKIKLITQIDRINWFLEKWISHHTKVFKKEELVFLVDDKFVSTDVFTKFLKKKKFKKNEINIISLHDLPIEYTARMRITTPFINTLQKQLLETYDVVIYLDIDELLYHPELREVLNTFTSDFLVTNTIDIIHNVNLEKNSFDFSKNVFSQRKFHNVSDSRKWYYKPIITRRPAEWGDGRHSIDGAFLLPSAENVYLIHLGKIDFEYANFLNKENIQMREKTISQNTYVDEELRSFFLSFNWGEIPGNFLSLDI